MVCVALSACGSGTSTGSRLEDRAVIEGRVLLVSDDGLADFTRVQIDLGRGEGGVAPETDGSFRFSDVEPDLYNLVIGYTGGLTPEATGSAYQAFTLKITAVAGSVTSLGTIALVLGNGTVSGNVDVPATLSTNGVTMTLRHGDSDLMSTPVDTNGTYAFASVPVGSYTVFASGGDLSGRICSGAPVLVPSDAAAVVVPTFGVSTSSLTSADVTERNGIWYTRHNTLNVLATAPYAAAIDYWVEGAPASSSSRTFTGGTAAFELTALEEGTNMLAYFLIDQCGLASDLQTVPMIVDTTPPAEANLIVRDSAKDCLEAPRAGCKNGYTNSVSAMISMHAVGATEMLLACDGEVSGKTWVPYAATAVCLLPAGDGDKTVTALFRDETGNETTAVSDTLSLDETRPTPPLLAAAEIYTPALSYPLAVALPGSFDASGVAFYERRVVIQSTACTNASDWTALGVPADLTFATPLCENAESQVEIRAVDLAGNRSSEAQILLVNDTLSPQPLALATARTNVDADAVQVTLSAAPQEANPSHYEKCVASDNEATCLSVGWNDPLAWTATTETVSFMYALAQNSTNHLCLRAVDRAGNRFGACLQVIEDSTPPVPPVLVSLPASLTMDANSVTLVVTSAAPEYFHHYEVLGGLHTVWTAMPEGSQMLTPLLQQNATNQIVARAVDQAGHVSGESLPVTVVERSTVTLVGGQRVFRWRTTSPKSITGVAPGISEQMLVYAKPIYNAGTPSFDMMELAIRPLLYPAVEFNDLTDHTRLVTSIAVSKRRATWSVMVRDPADIGDRRSWVMAGRFVRDEYPPYMLYWETANLFTAGAGTTSWQKSPAIFDQVVAFADNRDQTTVLYGPGAMAGTCTGNTCEKGYDIFLSNVTVANDAQKVVLPAPQGMADTTNDHFDPKLNARWLVFVGRSREEIPGTQSKLAVRYYLYAYERSGTGSTDLSFRHKVPLGLQHVVCDDSDIVDCRNWYWEFARPVAPAVQLHGDQVIFDTGVVAGNPGEVHALDLNTGDVFAVDDVPAVRRNLTYPGVKSLFYTALSDVTSVPSSYELYQRPLLGDAIGPGLRRIPTAKRIDLVNGSDNYLSHLSSVWQTSNGGEFLTADVDLLSMREFKPLAAPPAGLTQAQLSASGNGKAFAFVQLTPSGQSTAYVLDPMGLTKLSDSPAEKGSTSVWNDGAGDTWVTWLENSTGGRKLFTRLNDTMVEVPAINPVAPVLNHRSQDLKSGRATPYLAWIDNPVWAPWNTYAGLQAPQTFPTSTFGDTYDYGDLYLVRKEVDGNGVASLGTPVLIDTLAASPYMSGEQLVYLHYNKDLPSCTVDTGSYKDGCYDVVAYDFTGAVGAEPVRITISAGNERFRAPAIDHDVVVLGRGWAASTRYLVGLYTINSSTGTWSGGSSIFDSNAEAGEHCAPAIHGNSVYFCGFVEMPTKPWLRRYDLVTTERSVITAMEPYVETLPDYRHRSPPVAFEGGVAFIRNAMPNWAWRADLPE